MWIWATEVENVSLELGREAGPRCAELVVKWGKGDITKRLGMDT